jgi:hypothetical protein
MDAGVHDEAHSAKQFTGEAAVVADGVLIETDLLTELFGIERPTLDVSGVTAVLAKLGQSGQLLRHR